jgi:molybdopterin/thiamine biosynthesis adenylyltransferase
MYAESSAACISDMLMHVSNGAYMDGAKLSERFIAQVGILFDCMDSIEKRYIQYEDESK